MCYFKGALPFDVMLLGHWIEIRTVMGASKALEKLAELLPEIAHVIQPDGSIEDVALQNLKRGKTKFLYALEKRFLLMVLL